MESKWRTIAKMSGRTLRRRIDDQSVQSPIAPRAQNKQNSSTPHCPAHAARGSRISLHRCGSCLRRIVGALYEVIDCPKGNPRLQWLSPSNLEVRT